MTELDAASASAPVGAGGAAGSVRGVSSEPLGPLGSVGGSRVALPFPTSRAELPDLGDLRELAERAATLLAGAPADEIIAWGAETFGRGLAVASSMQDAVLVDLVSRHAPGTDVLFLETEYHFPETLATRDEVARRYDVRVRDLKAAQTPAEQDATYGKDLFDSNPDLCCLLRKTTPLFEALEGYQAWATGARRAEAVTRRNTAEVSFDEKHEIVKLAPLAAWSDEDVARYAAEHDVVRNPLLDDGYPSIGCAPCTRRVRPGEDPRAGRWAGKAKTECGINQ